MKGLKAIKAAQDLKAATYQTFLQACRDLGKTIYRELPEGTKVVYDSMLGGPRVVTVVSSAGETVLGDNGDNVAVAIHVDTITRILEAGL